MGIHSAKVTSKGQITLPVELRNELGLKPGDRIEFQRNDAGKIEIAARTKSIIDLRGSIKAASLPTKDIVEAVHIARTARADEIAARMRKRSK